MTIFVCEDTMDGIFTGIYDAWNSRLGHRNIRVEIEKEITGPELFCEYRKIETDRQKAFKVVDSIEKKLGHEFFEIVYYSVLSGKEGRADDIYRFLLLAFSVGSSCLEQLSHPYVHPIFERSRNVKREYQHYQGFLRFSELSSGILFSEIRPVNDLLVLLGEHFNDRFPRENWIIYEDGRRKAALHKKGTPFVMLELSGKEELLEKLGTQEFSEREKNLQCLWKDFINAIGIQERKNEKLQQQMLPLRFREFMREYDNPVKQRN